MLEGTVLADCHKLETVQILGNVTEIKSDAFANCYALKGLSVPVSVTTIGPGAFLGCRSLESIVLPPKVTYVDVMLFEDCYSLKSVVIPEGVTIIDLEAFMNCTALESITLPSTVNEIGADAFRCCSSLKSITIPEGVTEIKYSTFQDCTALESVSIPMSVTAIGESAFQDCKSLKALPSLGSAKTVESYAFSGCSALTAVTFPAGLKTIGDSAFRYCKALTQAVLPERLVGLGARAFGETGLTAVNLPGSLTLVDDSAFQWCSGIKTVTIGGGVAKIANGAFRGCTGITDVYYSATAADWANITIGSNNECLTSAAIHYGNQPIGEAETYKIYGEYISHGLVTTEVDGGTVRVYDSSGVLVGECVVSGGQFSIEGLPNGVYEVRAPSVSKYYDVTIDGEDVKLTPTNDHVWTDWYDVTAATCEAEGTQARSCFYCTGPLSKETRTVPALGHDYVNGTCSRCGGREPGAGVTVSVSVTGGADVTLNGQTVSGENAAFGGVAAGTYDLVVKKGGCLTYTIKGVNVSNADIDLGEIVMVAGDVNSDDKINIADMGVFRQEFGKTGEAIGNAFTDVNGDGKVNIADMGVFRQNFGKTAEKDCTVEYGA